MFCFLGVASDAKELPEQDNSRTGQADGGSQNVPVIGTCLLDTPEPEQ
jgi:hypothetical protein